MKGFTRVVGLIIVGICAVGLATSFSSPVCPKAATKDMCNATFTFDGTKSFDPTNRKLTYHWDFGDGATSDKTVETHTFAKPGEYTVTLTVKNDSGLECNSSTSTTVVRVNSAPVPGFTVPETICVGETIALDASSTVDDTSKNLTYSWDFGDGTSSEGVKSSKVFKQGGTYTVRLSVNDNENTPCSIATVEKTINAVEPPVANAGEDIDMCVAANQDFKVNFNAASAGAKKATYSWDFGDGDTGLGQSVIHTYAKTGTYNVTLKVDDGSGLTCGSNTDTLKVMLNRAPVAEAGPDIATCFGKEVAFDAGSAQSNVTYTWDFGDGETGTGAKATHTYKKGGAYQVTLLADDGTGSKCAKTKDTLKVTVNATPQVSLAKVEPVCPGTKVVLDAAKSSDPDGDTLVYRWDFGDGASAKGGAKEAHSYKEGGVYTVTVTVDDQHNSPCSSASDSIKVRVNRPPVANAGPNLVCCLGVESVFDGSGSSDPDGDKLTYHWDFGDGKSAEGAHATHRYTKAGKYKVVLTVKDDSGTACNTSSASFNATVSDKPVSIIKVR